nr:unnamed protein product [Callosobruchus analis]
MADYLPFFDGDTQQLESFIFRCDKFFNTYGTSTDNTLNDFVFNVICSKLKGNVCTFLMCRPDITTWPQIKSALREQFGDKIDRQTLTREFLQLSKYRNETILEFLERLKLIKSRVEVKIQTDPSLTPDQKSLLIDQNELNSLDVLTANCDDKLRLLLDIQQPSDLSQASNVVTKHFYNEMRIDALTRRHDHRHNHLQPSYSFRPRQNNYNASSYPRPQHPHHQTLQSHHTSYSYNNPTQHNQFTSNFNNRQSRIPHHSQSSQLYQAQFSQPHQAQFSQPQQPYFTENIAPKQQFPSQPITCQHLYPTDFDLQKIEIPPQSIVAKDIRTSLPEGTELILDPLVYKDGAIEFSSCITKVKDQKATIEIRNNTGASQFSF